MKITIDTDEIVEKVKKMSTEAIEKGKVYSSYGVDVVKEYAQKAGNTCDDLLFLAKLKVAEYKQDKDIEDEHNQAVETYKHLVDYIASNRNEMRAIKTPDVELIEEESFVTKIALPSMHMEALFYSDVVKYKEQEIKIDALPSDVILYINFLLALFIQKYDVEFEKTTEEIRNVMENSKTNNEEFQTLLAAVKAAKEDYEAEEAVVEDEPVVEEPKEVIEEKEVSAPKKRGRKKKVD